MFIDRYKAHSRKFVSAPDDDDGVEDMFDSAKEAGDIDKSTTENVPEPPEGEEEPERRAKPDKKETSADDVVDILNFDPFEKDLGGEEESEDESEPEASVPTSEGTTKAKGKDAEAPRPEQSKEDDESVQLRAQVQQLSSQLAAMQQLMAQQHTSGPTQQQPQGQQQQAPEQPKFNVQVPPQLLELLDSEEPGHRAQGITALINGTAQVAYEKAMADLRSEFEQKFEEVQNNTVQTFQSQTQSERIASDFYGKYSDLSDPTFRPVVQAVAQELQNEYLAQGKPVAWSEQFRDQLALRVYQKLRWQQPQAPNTQPAPRPKPPHTTGRNTRPAVGNFADSVERDIADTLFG